MKNGSRNNRSHGLEIAFSNRRRSQGSVQADTTDTSARRLQQSRMALAGLTQALTVSERHSAEVQKKLEALAEANSYLRTKLIEVERKVVMASHLAYHDALTGLPNRRLLLDRLNQAIARPSRNKRRVALVFFDVDGFKAINDRLGHANGDRVLKEIARRLSGCLRATDTACRYGGDEFIVMLPELEGEQGAAAVVRKIRAHLAAPYLVDGGPIAVTLSIGTAVYPEDARDCHQLIKLADAAMYSVKTDGSAPSRREKPADRSASGGRHPKEWIHDDSRVRIALRFALRRSSALACGRAGCRSFVGKRSFQEMGRGIRSRVAIAQSRSAEGVTPESQCRQQRGQRVHRIDAGVVPPGRVRRLRQQPQGRRMERRYA